MFLLSTYYVVVINCVRFFNTDRIKYFNNPILMLGQLREKTNNLPKVTLANKKMEEALSKLKPELKFVLLPSS